MFVFQSSKVLFFKFPAVFKTNSFSFFPHVYWVVVELGNNHDGGASYSQLTNYKKKKKKNKSGDTQDDRTPTHRMHA